MMWYVLSKRLPCLSVAVCRVDCYRIAQFSLQQATQSALVGYGGDVSDDTWHG